MNLTSTAPVSANRHAVLAQKIRLHVLKMIQRAKSSHIGTSYSMADLLAVLYGGVLRVDSQRPAWPERDRFILSKGHGCAGLYATLAEAGFFPLDWLDTFYQDGSRLMGHISHTGVPGVEFSTGSLGHGLSIGCGVALAAKRKADSYRTFVLLSDGECDEGSIWEAALFAPHHRLDNLVAIIDYNKIQSLGRVDEILNLEPFGAKWESFGWSVREIDGHDFNQIESTLSSVPFEPGKPSCIVAHTVKGKGVGFMENTVLWHYRSPNDEEMRQALSELNAGCS
ncbi:MAG: transketolase [Elusimicrobia bacterium]|nr:transketolase [Elusimicrobiota bacterium]